MIDPAIRTEAAHAARRDGRAAVAGETWPFIEHRPMSEVMRAELDAAVERAAKRIANAFDRATRP